MSESRPLKGSRAKGMTRIFHYDHTDDSYGIETVSNVGPLLEKNKIMYSSYDERARWSKDGFERVGSIPAKVWFALEKSGIAGNPELLKKWLNDPDNRKFRTRPGRV